MYHSFESPKVITLTAREKQAVDDAQAELKRMGYDISYFGGNDYAINAIPIDIKGYWRH